MEKDIILGVENFEREIKKIVRTGEEYYSIEVRNIDKDYKVEIINRELSKNGYEIREFTMIRGTKDVLLLIRRK